MLKLDKRTAVGQRRLCLRFQRPIDGCQSVKILCVQLRTCFAFNFSTCASKTHVTLTSPGHDLNKNDITSHIHHHESTQEYRASLVELSRL